MTRLHLLLLLTIFGALSQSRASVVGNGDAVYDNGEPDPTQLPWRSDFAEPVQEVDDFSLPPGRSTVAAVRWWGAYLYEVNARDDFTIRVYEDAGTRSLKADSVPPSWPVPIKYRWPSMSPVSEKNNIAS